MLPSRLLFSIGMLSVPHLDRLVKASRARAVDFDIVVIADLNTPIPGGSGNFTSFGSTSLDGGNVAFRGLGSGQDGILPATVA